MNRVTTVVTAMGLNLAVLAAQPVMAAAEAGHYVLDKGHSSALFSISHMGYSDLQGRFNDIDGKFTLNPKGKSQLSVVIKTASIDSNHEKRDKHLRSPDFFNSKRYPEITFSSSDVKFNAQGEVTKINGTLQMHGKSQPVSLDVTSMKAAKDPWGNYRAGYMATTTIKRSDFDMKYMLGGIGDEVKLNIAIEALKK